MNIRHDWRNKTKLLRPRFDESAARRLGITKQDVNDLLRTNFVGRQVGLYRDGTDLLPIVSRAPASERVDLDNWQELQIYSPVMDRFLPLAQVVQRIDVEWEDALILRRDRKRTLTVMADHDVLGEETATAVFERVRPQIEALSLPLGYELSWGGQHEASYGSDGAVQLVTAGIFGDVYHHGVVVQFRSPGGGVVDDSTVVDCGGDGRPVAVG